MEQPKRVTSFLQYLQNRAKGRILLRCQSGQSLLESMVILPLVLIGLALLSSVVLVFVAKSIAAHSAYEAMMCWISSNPQSPVAKQLCQNQAIMELSPLQPFIQVQSLVLLKNSQLMQVEMRLRMNLLLRSQTPPLSNRDNNQALEFRNPFLGLEMRIKDSLRLPVEAD